MIFFMPALIWELSIMCAQQTIQGRIGLRFVAYQQFRRSSELLEKWQRARPLLRVSQDDYAISLVWSMIDALERVAYNTFSENEKAICKGRLEVLRHMLNTLPPAGSPQRRMELHPGLHFLFV